MALDPTRFAWRRQWGDGMRTLATGFVYFNGHKTTVTVEFWDMEKSLRLHRIAVRSGHTIIINEDSLAVEIV
jgi:hypothetical protein